MFKPCISEIGESFPPASYAWAWEPFCHVGWYWCYVCSLELEDPPFSCTNISRLQPFLPPSQSLFIPVFSFFAALMMQFCISVLFPNLPISCFFSGHSLAAHHVSFCILLALHLHLCLSALGFCFHVVKGLFICHGKPDHHWYLKARYPSEHMFP